MILYFLKIVVLAKGHLLFKLIFKSTQLQKVPEYDIFQKTLFCTLAPSINLGQDAVPVATGQYLRREFTFIYLKPDHFWCFNVLLNKEKLKGKL